MVYLRSKEGKSGMSTLWVVSGMFGSGRTKLAEKIKLKVRACDIPAIVVSVDQTSYSLYEKYGFSDREEKENLKKVSEGLFKAKIVQCMRDRLLDVVVEGEFTEEWISFFEGIRKKYKKRVVVVNCNTADFDDVWGGRMEDYLHVYKSTVAEGYVEGKITRVDDEFFNKSKFKALYEADVYGKIPGDEVYGYNEMLFKLSEIGEGIFSVR